MTIDNYSVFLDSWFSEIEKVGIGVSGLNLDHLGYRVGIFELYKPLIEDIIKKYPGGFS